MEKCKNAPKTVKLKIAVLTAYITVATTILVKQKETDASLVNDCRFRKKQRLHRKFLMYAFAFACSVVVLQLLLLLCW